MTVENILKDVAVFHHIGIAVKDFKASVRFYTGLGYEASEPVMDKYQNVELVMLKSDTFPNIELIKPVDENSPVNNYLKNYNETIYHFCYETNDLKETLDILSKDYRVLCISKPKPAVLFDGSKVSFYYIKDVGIVEFLEK